MLVDRAAAARTALTYRRSTPRRCPRSSPPTGGRAVALLPGLPDDELLELAERVRTRVAADAGRRACRRGVGRAVAAGRRARARCTRRGSRSRRGRSSTRARTAARVGTWRDLGSFQLLLALQDHEALGLYCDAAARPDRGGRGPVRRRAHALARGVHRVQRAVGARGAAALLPPPHAALPDPADRGADRARPRLAPATGSSSGSPYAARRSRAR